MQNGRISEKRYLELLYFCSNYPEWIELLMEKQDTLRSKRITGMPLQKGTSDDTADFVIKREEMRRSCDLIVTVAEEVNVALSDYIVIAVCYGLPYSRLKVPCEEVEFKKAVEQFFYLLDGKLLTNANVGK